MQRWLTATSTSPSWGVPATVVEDVLAGRGVTITVVTPGVSPTAEATYVGQLQQAVRGPWAARALD